MITNEQREQLNSWFRCSVDNNGKADLLRESALHFAKAIMESVPDSADQDNALCAVRLAHSCAHRALLESSLHEQGLLP